MVSSLMVLVDLVILRWFRVVGSGFAGGLVLRLLEYRFPGSGCLVVWDLLL